MKKSLALLFIISILIGNPAFSQQNDESIPDKCILKDRITKLEAKVAYLEKQLTNQDNIISKINKKLEDSEKDYNNKVNNLDNRINNLGKGDPVKYENINNCPPGSYLVSKVFGIEHGGQNGGTTQVIYCRSLQ